MKKYICLLCALLLVLSLTACGNKKGERQADSQADRQTVRQGRITAIEGERITLTFMNEQPGQPGQNAPEMTGGQPMGNNGQPPEKPENGGFEGAKRPDSPQQPPDLPEGKGEKMPMEEAGETLTINLSEISLTRNGESIAPNTLQVGDMLSVTLDETGAPLSAALLDTPIDMGQGMAGGQPGGFGGGLEVNQGSSVCTITENGNIENEAFTSTGDDENALRIDGASVTLTGITVDKAAGASSNAEQGDFYGMNAALLATNGAQVIVENANISSSAQNGNGIFSYGKGTVVTVKNTVITTTRDNSGGIQTTGGGTTYGENLTITTGGNSSAAIRSDRGGGTVEVHGGTYTTTGYNSPAVYSTADITVTDAVLTAVSSEALVIEGKNTIRLKDCQVSGAMDGNRSTSGDENVHAVMIYQSMSGDAEVGTSCFTMEGGTLTGNAGDLFYVTNTHCILTLQGAELVNTDSDGALMRICGNSALRGWGKAGSNGAQAEVNCMVQTLNGDILVDTISTLSLTLKQGSTFTGRTEVYDNPWGGTPVGNNICLIIEEGCTWSLTGNSTLTALTNYGTILFNGFTVTLADGTVLGD